MTKPMKVYATEAEKAAIQKYAEADGRPVSNLLMHAVRIHVLRSKKVDKNGEVISLPRFRG